MLRQATADLSWLVGRGYADAAALKLVGDRFQLQKRQREAVRRASASPAAVAHRQSGTRPLDGARVLVDGFNVVVTVEAALSGGVVLGCRDGRLRDLSSVHGSYRRVEETAAALDLLVAALARATDVRWLLDRPVSNTRRLASMLRERGQVVEVTEPVDRLLLEPGWLPATADGPVLDRATGSVDLTRATLAGTDCWLVDLAAAAG